MVQINTKNQCDIAIDNKEYKIALEKISELISIY